MNAATILIIDDETDLCSMIKVVLTRENYQVDCAYTLKDAEEKLISQRPTIILLDNNLPDGSGLDYLHNHHSLFEQSTIIMITADIGPRTRNRALEEGITRYLQKPFTLHKIRELIKDVA